MGTGRSGTHWLGEIIASHGDVAAAVERWPVFHWATAMAVEPPLRTELLEPYLARHELLQHALAPRRVLDKSHPTIWLADELAERFPRARFVGIERDPRAVVASMLRHPEVLAWCENWQEFTLPSPFLGIPADGRDAYAALSLTERCALRWRSHHDELGALQARLGDRIHVVEYEAIHREPELQLSVIADFLGLPGGLPVPEIRTASLERWRDDLGAAQVDDIDRVVSDTNPLGVTQEGHHT